MPSPAPAERAQPVMRLESFAAYAALLKDKRDIGVLTDLERFVRPVRFEPGQFEFARPKARRSRSRQPAARLARCAHRHALGGGALQSGGRANHSGAAAGQEGRGGARRARLAGGQGAARSLSRRADRRIGLPKHTAPAAPAADEPDLETSRKKTSSPMTISRSI